MGFSNSRKVIPFYLLFGVFTCVVVTALSEPPQRHRRLLLQDADIEGKQEDEELVLPTKKKSTISFLSITSSSSSSKNKTKLLKPSSSSASSTKNQTKLIKPISGFLKNKIKTTSSDLLSSEAEGDGYSLGKTKVKKLNSTYKASSSSDSTKSSSISTKKPTDLLKTSSSPKNKTYKSYNNENAQLASEKIKKKKKEDNDEVNIKSTTAAPNKDKKKAATDNENQNQNLKKNPTTTISNKKQSITKTPSQPSWIYNTDDDDLVSDFKDLPAKFQKTIIPDLKRISSSSKVYFSKANREITKGFKPYVGNKYAPTIATSISCAFIIIPFFIVSLLFNRIKAYFSLQKLLIFVQVYLSIYFSILCLSSLVTGLEPLRFFYATSQSTYVWLLVLQTLGYVLYLLLLLMYLVLVFSTDIGLRSKFLGLAQTFVGFAVGLHYYMTVFHRMVLRQPPKASWKVHAIYATCFLVIGLLAGSDGRKKEYLDEGGEEGKKS